MKRALIIRPLPSLGNDLEARPSKKARQTGGPVAQPDTPDARSDRNVQSAPSSGRDVWERGRRSPASALRRVAKRHAPAQPTSRLGRKGFLGPVQASTEETAAARTLRLENAAGERVTVPGDSYFLRSDGTPRPEAKRIYDLISGRTARHQETIDRALTERHGEFEMSFRVKGPTGLYDKVQNVPVVGVVVPFREEHYRMLVQSTGPVMRALRDMLQVVYSKPDFTAEDLGLAGVSREEAEHVLETIRTSVYFEPKLVAPSMAEYPFLTVAGFDAAVGKLDEPQPIFYEYNLGTPSGLSNNVQLLEILRESDPEMFRAVADRLPVDRTFEILREAVESNALAWTRRPDGISVIVSPGSYNGAHPDVASIAMFSGMRIVEPSELYVDEDGWVRLELQEGLEDPVVTGIYCRGEESFFFQNDEDGIPIRGPGYENNPEIGARLGVKLEPGVAYAFKYDEDDQIVGVRLDENGAPRLQEVFGRGPGRDPNRPDSEPGSFARAVKERKLYHSALGGRTVDDKRIFQVVAEYLAPKYREADEPIARPPRTLKREEYSELYASANLENYVIKVPNESGGSGVQLLANMTPEERRRAVEQVRADPGRYIVQEFATPALALAPEEKDGTSRYGSIANDLRIFSMMDASGKVDAGPSSILLRVARPYSASTNTSQGAGYGIGVITSEDASRDPGASVLPPSPSQGAIGVRRTFDLEQFLTLLNRLTDDTDPRNGRALPRDGQASVLADEQRKVMDLLGRKFSPMMDAARKYDRGSIDSAELHQKLMLFRDALYGATQFPADVAEIVHRGLGGYRPAVEERRQKLVSAEERAALRRTFDIERFDEPVMVRQDLCGDGTIEKYAVGRYRKVAHARIDGVRRELEAHGGALHAIRLKDPRGEWSEGVAGAYFQVDDEGVPTIGVDLAQDFAVAAVLHELEHFRYWLEEARALKREGLDDKAARVQAMKNVNTPERRRISEELSVRAEMAAEKHYDATWNRGCSGAQAPHELGWASRVGYPYQEAAFDLLHRGLVSGEVDRGEVKVHLNKLIDFALEERRTRFALLDRRSSRNRSEYQAARVRSAAYADLQRSLFDLAFGPGMVARAEGLGVSALLHGMFAEALTERLEDLEQLVPLDHARFRAQIQ